MPFLMGLPENYSIDPKDFSEVATIVIVSQV